MPRTAYDTSVKHLYRLNCETAIPLDIRNDIPRTNRHRWRTESPTKYLGFELNHIAATQLKLLQQFAANRKAQTAFRAYLRIAILLRSIFLTIPKAKSIIREHSETIVQEFERVKQIPLNALLKFVQISPATYHGWKHRLLFKCIGSPTRNCLRRNPQQTSPSELATMKTLLQTTRFLHWPIVSLAGYARRKGILVLSNHTWYKYTKLLGISRIPAPKPKHKAQGLVASHPGQFIHADSTFFTTLDGHKAVIHIAIDNFSRKILAWKVAAVLRAANMIEVIRIAVAHAPKNQSATIVTDGGSENDNRKMTAFLEEQPSITHLVAQRDISFSNSMVEAFNRILKSRYLRPHPPPNLTALEKAVAFAVHEYNDIRPHGSLKDLTPSEAFADIQADSLRIAQKMKTAQIERIQRNRKPDCNACISKVRK